MPIVFITNKAINQGLLFSLEAFHKAMAFQTADQTNIKNITNKDASPKRFATSGPERNFCHSIFLKLK